MRPQVSSILLKLSPFNYSSFCVYLVFFGIRSWTSRWLKYSNDTVSRGRFVRVKLRLAFMLYTLWMFSLSREKTTHKMFLEQYQLSVPLFLYIQSIKMTTVQFHLILLKLLSSNVSCPTNFRLFHPKAFLILPKLRNLFTFFTLCRSPECTNKPNTGFEGGVSYYVTFS